MTDFENTCEHCDKPTDEAYEMPNGDYVCLACYTSAGDRAEAQWEAQQETEAGGN